MKKYNSRSHQDLTWYNDVPRSISSQLIIGMGLLIFGFGGFCYWAFSAPLAAAVITQGSFVATGKNKIIQHLEGGIIAEIFVQEGDHVQKGDPLLRLDETSAKSNQQQFYLRQVRLEAIYERLQAQSIEAEKFEFSPHLIAMRENNEVANILDSQMQSFIGSRNSLNSELVLFENNIKALEFRADGYERQRKSMISQIVLLRDELRGKESLYKKGLMRKTDVIALRRAIEQSNGQVARLKAQVSEANAEIERFRNQAQQSKAVYKKSSMDELQKIAAELDSVREKARDAESILKRVTITAPVSGTVVRMLFHSAGGVIESGKTIAEILPTEVPLIIESQVPRSEIDNVKVGQKAVVRLSALNQRTTPILNGEVFYVSADALPGASSMDQPQEVYLARVSLSAAELHRVRGFSPTPGMPAEVMIQTAERTFFDYLSRPVVDSMGRAFKEQ